MRALIVIGMFFIAFLWIAGTSMAGVDLTPDTPYSGQAPEPLVVPVTSQSQVNTVQENPALPEQSAAIVPVTGGCADPYTVVLGDSLSKIAVLCSSTLAFIRQANPQIVNIHLIYPGQQVNLSIGSSVIIPDTGSEEAAAPVVLLPQICIPPPVPVTGLSPMIRPGTGLSVTVRNFPPNAKVDVAIGQTGTSFSVVATGVTDASGYLIAHITAPASSNSQASWVVVVTTTDQPHLQVWNSCSTQNSSSAISQPFFIGP